MIVSIGGREPQDGPHAMRILRSYQPGESVELGSCATVDADAVGQGARAPAHDVMHPVTPPQAAVPAAAAAPPSRETSAS